MNPNLHFRGLLLKILHLFSGKMSEEFNEDLLKEALDFDLDDYAIDSLVDGLTDDTGLG